MTHIRSIILSAVAVAALSTAPAMAQSVFDGAYVGAMGGYDWFSGHAKSGVGGGASRNQADGSGATAGVFAGYGQTFDLPGAGTFYLGAEGEGSFYTGDNTQGNALAQNHVSPDYSAGASLRIGYLVLPDALLFARIGWAHTGVDFDTTPVGGSTTHDYRSFDGIRAGGGVDYMVTDHLFTRIEYVYTDYGRAGVTSGPLNTGFEPEEHQIRVGVGVHF